MSEEAIRELREEIRELKEELEDERANQTRNMRTMLALLDRLVRNNSSIKSHICVIDSIPSQLRDELASCISQINER